MISHSDSECIERGSNDGDQLQGGPFSTGDHSDGRALVSRVGFVANVDADFEPGLCGRFRHQVLDESHTAEDDALTRACQMRKQTMLDRVVFGRVRWIVGDPDLHAYLLHDLCEVLFEQISACAIAPPPSHRSKSESAWA
jgi:hypothetical protein